MSAQRTGSPIAQNTAGFPGFASGNTTAEDNFAALNLGPENTGPLLGQAPGSSVEAVSEGFRGSVLDDLIKRYFLFGAGLAVLVVGLLVLLWMPVKKAALEVVEVVK